MLVDVREQSKKDAERQGAGKGEKGWAGSHQRKTEIKCVRVSSMACVMAGVADPGGAYERLQNSTQTYSVKGPVVGSLA